MDGLLGVVLLIVLLFGGMVLAVVAALFGSTFFGTLFGVRDDPPLRLIGGVCGAAVLTLAAYVITLIQDQRPGPGLIFVALLGLICGVNAPRLRR